MARLILCPSCSEFVARTERVCPRCNAVFPEDRSVVFHAAGAVLLGLSLAGCPADDDDETTNTTVEPDYGVPATESTTVDMTASGTMTSGATMTSSATETTMTTGEPEYGVPETESFTGSETDSAGTDTGGTAGSDSSTSLEPDYGLPDTE